MVDAPAWSAGWLGFGTGFNYLSVQATGPARVDWGDGVRESFTINHDLDGDGINETAFADHQYAADGLYKVKINDRPNDPSTPTFSGWAYMFANDPDGADVRGSTGDDVVITGPGDDSLNLREGDDWASTGGGDDLLRGRAGNDILMGGDGADRIFGDEGDDLGVGGDNDDEIHGGDGMDFLYGGAGADALYAEADGGFLNGEAGSDKLFAGSGSDTFVFSSVSDTGRGRANADHIYGFEQGPDRIDLSQLFPGGFTFIGAGAFSASGGGEVLAYISGWNTRIYGDVDGDGAPDFEIRLSGNYTLTEADFGI